MDFNIAANIFLIIADLILAVTQIINIMKIFQNGVKEQQYVRYF